MYKAIASRKSSTSRAVDWPLLGVCSKDGSGGCMWHLRNDWKSSVGSVHLSVLPSSAGSDLTLPVCPQGSWHRPGSSGGAHSPALRRAEHPLTPLFPPTSHPASSAAEQTRGISCCLGMPHQSVAFIFFLFLLLFPQTELK